MGSDQGKSWNDIMAQFDGKKSLEDIIVQFMQFPITNFNPSEHQIKLKHNQVKYEKEEHVIIMSFRSKCCQSFTKNPLIYSKNKPNNKTKKLHLSL